MTRSGTKTSCFLESFRVVLWIVLVISRLAIGNELDARDGERREENDMDEASLMQGKLQNEPNK